LTVWRIVACLSVAQASFSVSGDLAVFVHLRTLAGDDRTRGSAGPLCVCWRDSWTLFMANDLASFPSETLHDKQLGVGVITACGVWATENEQGVTARKV